MIWALLSALAVGLVVLAAGAALSGPEGVIFVSLPCTVAVVLIARGIYRRQESRSSGAGNDD